MIPGTIPTGNFVNTFGARTVSFLSWDYDQPVLRDATYSFTGTSLGTAATDRWIIVGVNGIIESEAGRTLSSCTVNGYTGVILTQARDSNNQTITALVLAYCPLGASGTIAVNFNDDIRSCYIGVWEVHGLVGYAPVDINSDTSGAMSFSLNTLADGFIVAVGTAEDTFIGLATWTNVTERYDEETSTIIGFTATGADTTTSGASVTVSLSVANQDNYGMVAASF